LTIRAIPNKGAIMIDLFFLGGWMIDYSCCYPEIEIFKKKIGQGMKTHKSRTRNRGMETQNQPYVLRPHRSKPLKKALQALKEGLTCP